jgi:hypothetical protein
MRTSCRCSASPSGGWASYIAKCRRYYSFPEAFEQLSGLNINFCKIELFYFGDVKELVGGYSQIFCCEMGFFPFHYLGIPMHYRKLRNRGWKDKEESFQMKLSCWKGKMLSVGGRLVLINFVLSNLSIFMLSFFEVPREI